MKDIDYNVNKINTYPSRIDLIGNKIKSVTTCHVEYMMTNINAYKKAYINKNTPYMGKLVAKTGSYDFFNPNNEGNDINYERCVGIFNAQNKKQTRTTQRY